MNILTNKRFLIFTSLTILLGFTWVYWQYNLANKKLLQIFIHSEKSNDIYTLNERIEDHILSCCSEETNAVRLLKDNGFSITTYNEPNKVKELNAHWQTQNIGYDTFIFGENKVFPPPTFDSLFTSYSVTLLIKEGQVKAVSGRINSSPL